MNAYTHSGLQQLVRQLSDGRIEAVYLEEELLDGLRAATASVLLLGYPCAWARSGNIRYVRLESVSAAGRNYSGCRGFAYGDACYLGTAVIVDVRQCGSEPGIQIILLGWKVQ
jgi:hypothetical protein